MLQASVPPTVGLPVIGKPVSAVRGDTFTCRYAFADGALQMSVTDLHTIRRAHGSFRELEQTQSVESLTGLGQGGFRRADGSVVAIKDAMILTVDVASLPPTPFDKSGIAIDLATTVLGCWSGRS